VTAVVGVGVASEAGRVAPASAGDATSENTDVVQAASAESPTARAVAAANAFLKSLSSSQRASAQYAFASSSKASGWSNLPVSLVQRNGVAIGSLSSSQAAKLTALLKTILSTQGYSDEEAVRAADAYLDAQGGSGGGGRGGGLSYGSGLYYIAFFGTPSTSRKWTVQFGGHHLAIHLTFSGATVSNTPYFVGAEPQGSFTVGGKAYAPMADEAAALFGAVQALNSSQLTKAKLSQSFDDVLVGPGKDGQFPARQGITVSSLSAAQQALVTTALRAYVGDMPTAPANARIALYKKQYAQTKLAWATSTNASTQGAYVRLHGPRLWIEIVVQNGIVLSGVHYHSIERDAKTDYGAGT
jgi:hypothetical protein